MNHMVQERVNSMAYRGRFSHIHPVALNNALD